MASYLLARDIPKTRADALHILWLNDDDPDNLDPEQIIALRRIYRLDEERMIAEFCLAGEI